MLLILQIFTARCAFPAALAVGLRFYRTVRPVMRFRLALSWPRPFSSAAEIRSVSGRIGSIGDAEFTLDLNKKEPEKRKLLIDSETKMEAIGTNAAVDYRSSDGKNIAARVIVVADSGLRP